MAVQKEVEEIRAAYDISLIRPAKRIEEIKFRRSGLSKERQLRIKRGLRTFHTFETLAGAIYRFQMTKRTQEPERLRIAAMCNEMTHLQDFQVKLYEYGWTPSKTRWAFWLVGMALGLITRLMGIRRILMLEIWAEKRAVDHYQELLATVDWDDDTRPMVEKNLADEIGHVERWTALLKAHDVRKLTLVG